MSQDLIKRLRENADLDEMEGCTPSVVALEREAANRIEQLEAELKAAREMLRKSLIEIDHLIQCANTDHVPFDGDETHELREEIVQYLSAAPVKA